jgi:hypothetical protein
MVLEKGRRRVEALVEACMGHTGITEVTILNSSAVAAEHITIWMSHYCYTQ